MTLTSNDIVTLRPTPDDVAEAVRYAIKTGASYTYNRMGKTETWKRVARIARGKVNESLIRRFAESLGITPAAQDKNYRQYDAFDFVFNARGRRVDADVKTFHVLTRFVKPPRDTFSVVNLLCGVDHTAAQWHMFFPMLVPHDQKRRPKEVYVFAVSVEAKPDAKTKSALTHPWTAFPDGHAEQFLTDTKEIQARERDGSTLTVTISWPQGMPGAGVAIYERNGKPSMADLQLKMTNLLTRAGVSSFLALRLDDTAHGFLRTNGAVMTLTAQEGKQPSCEFSFGASRFYEVFPREDFTLYLIGWIGRQEFDLNSQPLPDGTPCYFYPPKEDSKDKHEPGTKTRNRYVLPGELQPITKLTEA